MGVEGSSLRASRRLHGAARGSWAAPSKVLVTSWASVRVTWQFATTEAAHVDDR
jgi:hypothetical protein